MLSDVHAHPRDTRIVFYEEPHLYYVDGENNSTSVTTLIHKFFPAFDAISVAKKVHSRHHDNESSEYYNMSIDDIIASWEANRDEAAFNGTLVHKIVEDYYNSIITIDNIVDASNIHPELNHFVTFLQDFSHLKPYRSEWVVFHEEYHLAGSIDMTFLNKDGSLSIYDWKRSKKISLENRYEKGSPPIQHLDSCNYIQYSLQLNTYRFILETKYGMRVSGMYLVVLHPNNMSYLRYEVNDMQDDVNAMLNFHLKSVSV